MSGKLRDLEQKKKEIGKRIELSKGYKQNIIGNTQELLFQYTERKINYSEYNERLGELLQGKSIQEWIDYYDNYTKYCEDYLISCGKEIRREKGKLLTKKAVPFLAIFGVLVLLVLVFTFFIPTQIPIFLAPPVAEVYTDDLNLVVSESMTYDWALENLGSLQSVKVSGLIEGEGEVKIYLVSNGDEWLILDSVNLGSFGNGVITGNVVHEDNQTENESEEENEAESEDETVIDPPLNITNEIPIDQPVNVTNETVIDPPLNITNDTIEEELPPEVVVIDFVEICEETCDLSEFDLNKGSYTLRIEIIGNAELNLDLITYEILKKVVGPPIDVPPEVSKVSFYEQETARGKRVIVSGNDELIDVPVSTEIPESWNIRNSGSLSVYWVEDDSFVDFEAFDLNNNDKIDSIEWVVPHLSNQTFDIIVITRAEHLDSNRNFISNIYTEVVSLDSIWSETIPNQDYVRVTFELPLDNTKDITLFPRTISGNPRIEIYEVNQDVLIAEFTNIIDNEYNIVSLIGLQGSQDVFDLRVIGGSVEIDHIVDPVTLFRDPTADIDGPSTDNWIRPANAYVSNDLYARAKDTADHKWFTYGFGSVIPAGSTIEGIEVRLEWNTKKATDQFIIHAQLLDANGVPIGIEQITPIYGGAADIISVLGSSSFLWGASWTDIDIVDADFGVRITSEKISGSGGARTFLDNVDIRVTYTETSPSNPPTVIITSIDGDDFVDLNPGGTQPVTIIFDVEDLDGLGDLDEATLSIDYGFPSGGPFTEQRSLFDVVTDCTSVDAGNVRTYDCTLNIEYFDSLGIWDAIVSIDDVAGEIGIDTSPFVVNPLLDISLLNTPISFGVVDIGQQVPTIIIVVNNGNVVIPDDRGLQVTSGTLASGTVLDTISSSRFRAAGTPVANACVSGDVLSDITPTTLNVVLGRGDGTGGNNEETLTFCLDVPNVAEASYSAIDGDGAWIITILSVPFIVRRSKRKKNRKLKDKIKLETEEIQIPILIFKQKLGPSEALCKYLKENLGLKFNEIAKLINRDQRTIWINYRNAIKKKKENIEVEGKVIYVSVKIFADRKFSILESLVIYFRERGFSNSEIAEISGKGISNIWTLYSRARKKIKLRIEEIQIPIPIFKQKLGPSEALTKYLKENIGLKFSEIAKLLNRDQRTVWINYRNAIKKKKKETTIGKEEIISISIKVFGDRRLSILESLVIYFRERGLSNSEIAEISGKGPSNIWTLYSRARKKLNISRKKSREIFKKKDA